MLPRHSVLTDKGLITEYSSIPAVRRLGDETDKQMSGLVVVLAPNLWSLPFLELDWIKTSFIINKGLFNECEAQNVCFFCVNNSPG